MRYLDLIWEGVKMLPEIVMFVSDVIVAINKIRKVVKSQRVRARKKRQEYKRRQKDSINK